LLPFDLDASPKTDALGKNEKQSVPESFPHENIDEKVHGRVENKKKLYCQSQCIGDLDPY
jgi:hypothetical protein